MPAKPRVDRLKTIYTAAKGLNYSWKLTDYLSAPQYNGITAYLPQLHRITIRFCKKAESSAGVRNYIERTLFGFAEENPSVAVYVLPTRNTTPTLRAEYGCDRMVHVNVTNCSAEKIAKWMNLLRTRSGLPIVDFELRQTAASDSVQGIWSPFCNLSSEHNLPHWPKEKFSEHRSDVPSAQEYISSFV